MTPEDVVHIGNEAMTLAVLLAAPLLLTRMQYCTMASGMRLGFVEPLTGSLMIELILVTLKVVVGLQKVISWIDIA